MGVADVQCIEGLEHFHRLVELLFGEGFVSGGVVEGVVD